MSLATVAAGIRRGECNGFELEELVRAQRRLISWLEAECLASVAELAHCPSGLRDTPALRAPSIDSHAAAVLEPLLGWSTFHAGWYLSVALTLAELPRTRAALAGGDIDLATARVIAERLGALASVGDRQAVEEALFPDVIKLSGGLLRMRVEAEVIKVDPAAAAERHRRARNERGLDVYPCIDGVADLRLHGIAADEAAQAYAYLDAIARSMKAAGDTRTLPQLRADIATSLLAGNADITTCQAETAPCRPATAAGEDQATQYGPETEMSEPQPASCGPSDAGACKPDDTTAYEPGESAATEPDDKTATEPDDIATPEPLGDAFPPESAAGGLETCACESAGSTSSEAGPAASGPEPAADAVEADRCGSKSAGYGLANMPQCGPTETLQGGPTETLQGEPAETLQAEPAEMADPAEMVRGDPPGASARTNGGDAGSGCPHTGCDHEHHDRFCPCPDCKPAVGGEPLTDQARQGEDRRTGAAVVSSRSGGGAATAASPSTFSSPKVRVRARIQFNVPLTTMLGLGQQPGELGGFGPVVAEVTRRIIANQLNNPDARFGVGITDPVSGRLLHLHPIPRRFLRGLQAELVEALHQRCSWITCHRPAADCDLDHLREHAAGGDTSVVNNAPACPGHHKVKSESDWTLIQTSPGQVTWTDPHSRTYTKRAPSLTDPSPPAEPLTVTDLPPF